MNPSETVHGKLALEFANALVQGDYYLAQSLTHLQEDINLESEFMEMIEYGDGPITHIEVMNEMVSWSTRQENDVGWAYVALAGDGFAEAVAVVVSKLNGSLKITEIEWGVHNA